MSRAGLALLWLALVSGCAYYNTFYHAKKYFAKAERIQEEARTERLSPEAVKNYDKAIEKAAKVIVEHGGGWRAGIDDALFLMGASYYGKRDYQTAIGKFNELLLNYPESDHVPEALFYTGLCYHQMRNFGTATRVFENLLREHPDFERRDEILMISAEGLEDAGDERAALRQYKRLLGEFSGSEEREEALERVGEIYFDEGRYDSALVAYEELARTTRDDDLYFEAQLNAGACLVRLGRYDDALSIYERILPDQPERNELGARVWLAMADALNRAGEPEQALEYLERVVEYFESRTQGVEALFQIGYTQEVHLQDYEAARAAYERAIASRTRSVFKEQAQRRLENLDYVMELASSQTEETAVDRRAEAALKVAEFTLFEGQDETGALEQYAAVRRQYPGTDAALRAAYAEAWLLMRNPQLDSLGVAGTRVDSLVRAHPESPQAQGAVRLLIERGAPDSLLRPLETIVFAAQREAALRDSIARADSLATARARVDSLAAVARADSLAAAAQADSLAAAMRPEAPRPALRPDSLAAGGRDSLFSPPDPGASFPLQRTPDSTRAAPALIGAGDSTAALGSATRAAVRAGEPVADSTGGGLDSSRAAEATAPVADTSSAASRSAPRDSFPASRFGSGAAASDSSAPAGSGFQRRVEADARLSAGIDSLRPVEADSLAPAMPDSLPPAVPDSLPAADRDSLWLPAGQPREEP